MRQPPGVERGDRPTRPPRICFVAPQAYNVLSQDADVQHIGGAEVQQVAIAQELAKRGYDVSFVTFDYGQPDDLRLDGIRVFKSYRPSAGIPGARFFVPRLTSMWAALGRADADVYYQRTSDSLTGIVAAFCRMRRRRFVFALGAMADCDPTLPNCRTLRERVLYRYGLRRADRVIAQTDEQRERLRACFGRDAVVIPSCAPEPARAAPAAPRAREGPVVLWVGRFCREKRPEVLLALARRCPQVQFDIVGAGFQRGSHARMTEEAQGIRNVRFLGYVPYHEMPSHYERATALVCTSGTEGFPNTFLEAWSHGVPVLTTCDPGGAVRRSRAGVVVAGSDDLARAIEELCDSPSARNEMSRAGRTWYRMHHHPSVVGGMYDELVLPLARSRNGATARTRMRPCRVGTRSIRP